MKRCPWCENDPEHPGTGCPCDCHDHSNPRGGSMNIGSSDILGGLGGCWCGKAHGHDWPGKSEKKPHPRG